MTSRHGTDGKLSKFFDEEVEPKLDVKDVFGDLELRGTGKERYARCPLPSHSRKGRGDANFSVNVDTLKWYCQSQCQIGGGAIKYVMLTEGLSYREAVLKLAERACVDTSELTGRRQSSTSPAQPKPVVRRVVESRADEAPLYPPVDEVRALWADCISVTDAPHAANYLRASKRIDPALVGDFDVRARDARDLDTGLARALRPGARLPSWARLGRTSWWEDGYELIAPMVDARGELRSVTARNVFPDAERRRLGDGKRIPKSAAPKGEPNKFSRHGLVFVCPLARHVFRTGRAPADWPPTVPLRFQVCEGEIKQVLRACMLFSDAAECVPAVIGVVSGAWTSALAARIPDGSSLVLFTDQNPAGARYATEIVRSFGPRIRSRTIRVDLRHEFEFHRDDTGQVAVRLTPAAQAAYDAKKAAAEAAESR